MNIRSTGNPTAEELQVIRDGLSAYNVREVPLLLALPYDDVLVVLRDANRQIIGGAIGEFDWGMLFVDTLWVADELRGNGYATRIMQQIEGFAAEKGITSAYLFTTSFQARGFYERMGYRVFAQLADYPRGHTIYYMQKDDLRPILRMLEIQSPPQPDDFRLVNDALIADIARHVPLEQERYAILLEDDDGTIRGGLWGGFYWDWFDLRFLWIDGSLRGHGYGKQILDQLVQTCEHRSTVGIRADTADFQALPFYLAQGFEIFGEIIGRPPGHTSYFIQRQITGGGRIR